MPSVQRAYEDFKNTEIELITISIDDRGTKDVKPFLKQHGYTMSVLIDIKKEEFSKLGLLGTPGTFVINRAGKIVAKGVGPVDFDRTDFREYVKGLL